MDGGGKSANSTAGNVSSSASLTKPTNTSNTMSAKNTTATPNAASRTIATTNTDGMVVFSLQDLNAEILGQVAGVKANSSAAGVSRASASAGGQNKFRYRRHHYRSSHNNDDDATMTNEDNISGETTNANSTSDEENSAAAASSKSNSTKKKASRNSASYKPAASGRRSNNLRPHATKYLPPFLQNGGGGGIGKSGGGRSKSGLHTHTSASPNNSSLAGHNKQMNHHHHHHTTTTGSTTKRAPPPIKTAIRFEEDDGAYVQHHTATTAPASTATSTSASTTMMSSPLPSSSSSERRRASSNTSSGSGSGRYQQQRTPHTMRSNDRHPHVHDASVYGAICFNSASTPEEDDDDDHVHGRKGGGRKTRFSGGGGNSMSGGGRTRGGGSSITANGKKQQYRKTPHWKKKGTSSAADASSNKVNDDEGMQSYYYQGDYDYETGFITNNHNLVSGSYGNGEEWYSPFSSPAPFSQYNYEYEEEYRHHPPQAPPSANDGKGSSTKNKVVAMMSNAALDYIHSTRAEVASLTSPNIRALNAAAKPWNSNSKSNSSFKSTSSSVAASASKSATPLGTSGTSYSSSTNDFQVLSPKSDLTSNATKTPSTGGTRSSTYSGSGSGIGAANQSPFVSPTTEQLTEQLASWAFGASPTSSSVDSALEKSLLSPGSTLSASVAAASGGSSRASTNGRVVRTPDGSIGIGSSDGMVPSGGGFNLSSPGNADATIVQSTGGSIGIGDVSHYLLSASGPSMAGAAANSSPAEVASPTAIDKTDAAICLGGGGGPRGVLSPTTTIASEDAFTPSLRADESGHGAGASADADAAKSPDDEGIKTKKADASTWTDDTDAPSGVPKMVEARTQTEDMTGHGPTKESSSSIGGSIMTKPSSMKIDATPKGQGQAKKTAMNASAAEFTPSFSKMSIASTARALPSTTTGHAYAPTASSTPAPILSAKTQLAYIPMEINGVIHYVPTHVVLPASSPYSYTQHYPIPTMAEGVGASIAAESGARPRKPCRITSPATNDARAKSTMAMNALAQEFEPSPTKDE